MPFQLLTPTAATLKTVTPRTEIHGDEPVSAISLGLSITGPNTLLDALDGGKLRNALYMAVPDQEQLPGVEPSTPLLRARGIEEVKCAGKLEGWTVAFQHGIGDDIQLGGSKIDKLRVVPMEGGSIELLFRVGTSDISEDEAGALFGKLGQEVMITVTAPVIASGAPIIDGSKAAFEADHPDAGDLFAAEASQAEIDAVAAHDDSAGPGAGSSDDAPFDEQPQGEAWPVEVGGTDSEGGETDASSDAAEFEAGAKAAIQKATGGRRGKRTRAVVE